MIKQRQLKTLVFFQPASCGVCTYCLIAEWTVYCLLPAVCNHNLATKLSTKTRSHLGRKFAPTDLAKKAKHAIAIDLLLFPGGTFPIIKVLAAASQELSTTNIQIENLYNKLTLGGPKIHEIVWFKPKRHWSLKWAPLASHACPSQSLFAFSEKAQVQ